MLRYLVLVLAFAWIFACRADLPGSGDAALLSQLLSDLTVENEVEKLGGGGDGGGEGIVEKTNVVDVIVETTNVVDVIVEKTNYVEKVVEAPKPTGRPAKITSKATYFDRKEGVGVFTGNVHVDDEQYQLHADKVYLFMEGTNDVRRVVALGHVAMTNFCRMAYADKASYYRQNGMIVLYSGGGIDAEVRDESKSPAQTVRGEKIKFWIDSEQVEVVKAKIETPTSGLKDMKGLVK